MKELVRAVKCGRNKDGVIMVVILLGTAASTRSLLYANVAQHKGDGLCVESVSLDVRLMVMFECNAKNRTHVSLFELDWL